MGAIPPTINPVELVYFIRKGTVKNGDGGPDSFVL